MDWKILAVFTLAVTMGLTGGQAHAAHKKRPPRITVTKRSCFDAGTEVMPGDRKFTDYAFPPGYSPFDVFDPTRSQRFPLPDRFWLPGW